MRGAVSGDGKLRGNRQMVDRYNEARSERMSEEPETKAKPGERKQKRPRHTGGESGGVHEPSGHDEIKSIVGEHGHATSHHIYKTGRGFSSMTHHEDGHVHGPVDHDTLGTAHEHGEHAMGEDTAHLGDMPPEDYEIAGEKEGVESRGGMGGSRVGELD